MKFLMRVECLLLLRWQSETGPRKSSMAVDWKNWTPGTIDMGRSTISIPFWD
jgi:hypothetical protein